MTWPTLTLASFVLAVGALHAAGMSIMLFRSDRAPHRARLCLAWLAMVLAVLLAEMALTFSEIRLLGPVGGALVGSLWFGIGPLFYGSVRFLLPDRAQWQPEDILHPIPFLLQLIVLAAYVAGAITPEGGGLRYAFVVLYVLQSAAYAAAAVLLARGYAARYRRETAGAATEHLAHVHRLLILFGVYVGASAVNLGVLTVTKAFIPWLDYLVPLALAVLVGQLGLALLRRPDSVLPPLALPDPLSEPAPTPVLAQTTPVIAPETAAHARALRALMETQRLYLDPEIRLGTLATSLGVSERTLSHVLAEAFGGTFYDVVNGYRVREAQARLTDPAYAQHTVLAVGLDAGFSSKSSFNRVFKQQTGETPSAFRKRMPVAPSALPTLTLSRGDGQSGSHDDDHGDGYGDGMAAPERDAAMPRRRKR